MQSVLCWSLLSLVILSHWTFLNGAPSSSQCPDTNLNIIEGSYTLSNFYNHGSILRYLCPKGFYPHPVKKRVCETGQWNPQPNKKTPVCKKVTCPNPNVLKNGVVEPFQKYYFVNDTTTYNCHSDYTFRGSAARVCQANGKWNGTTPVCSYNNEHCPDPGIPPGTTRQGHIFNIDDQVTYTCDKNLKLIGSKVRVCLDGGYWSGKEPECYAEYTYDTPEEVAEAFGSSLRTTVTLHEKSDQTGKKIRLNQTGVLDIYIALDASDSIKEEDFSKAKDIIKKLLTKISIYEVHPNYEISIFATDVKQIVDITDYKKNKLTLADIFKSLDAYNYDDEDRKKTGTNIRKAYEKIRSSISFEKANNKNVFDQTQHVIIMFTDGIANIGGDPKPVIEEIKEKVEAGDRNREKYLDLYAFGVGDDVEKEKMDDWVTKRYNNDKYFFMLEDIEKVGEALDEMIDESTSKPLCGLYKEYYDINSDESMRRTYPWLISISIIHERGKANCIGSLVTPMFILTAAHCFRFDDRPEKIHLTASNSKEVLGKVERFILHPDYDLKKKEAQGIEEFYEYDVALIQLTEPVEISPNLRTICIPCTDETNRALQLPVSEASCEKHREVLLNTDLVRAHFIKHDLKKQPKQSVLIRQRHQKLECLKQAEKVFNITEGTAQTMITDNFFCTGGASNNYEDSVTCKGDSGGPVYLELTRLIQVGVISWGLKDTCILDGKQKLETRDFHIDLFNQKVRDFLEMYLGNDEIAPQNIPLKFL